MPVEQPTMAEELNREVVEVLRDLSEPDDVRVLLANFFQRRAYNLQHKKYKVLLRWAHFALVRIFLSNSPYRRRNTLRESDIMALSLMDACSMSLRMQSRDMRG